MKGEDVWGAKKCRLLVALWRHEFKEHLRHLQYRGILLGRRMGFLMFRYPRFFADLNARFGFRMFSSPKYIAFTRKLGIVEMILAGVSAVSLIVSLIFGLKWFESK
jgi:hypothetical protein